MAFHTSSLKGNENKLRSIFFGSLTVEDHCSWPGVERDKGNAARMRFLSFKYSNGFHKTDSHR